MRNLLGILAGALLVGLMATAHAVADEAYSDVGFIPEGIGGDFTLDGPGGKPVSLSEYRGKVVLLYFGYTTCPDICPTSLSVLGRAMRHHKDRKDEFQGIFVTIDPNRDTGPKLQNYVQYFNPNFIALSGDEAATATAARKWYVTYQVEEGDSAAGYLVSHSDFIYIVGRDGNLAALFSSTSKPSKVTEVLGKILDEK